MKPVDFPGANTTFGKEQPEYLPLPAYWREDEVTSCWELTPEEVNEVIATRRIYVTLVNFNQPLQPQRVSVYNPIIEDNLN